MDPNDNPLVPPREVFAPFSVASSKRLRQYVQDVIYLADLSFFSQIPSSVTLSYDDEGELSEDIQEPEDEAVRAAASRIRQLYASNEPTSTDSIMQILHESLREKDGARRAAATKWLKDLKKSVNRNLRSGIGVGIKFEGGPHSGEVEPKQIVDAYFHGKYFHSGNAKSDLVEALDDIGPFGRQTFYVSLLHLAQSYQPIANNVKIILSEPSLLDAAN
jgi:hypothetical protein